MWIVAGPNGAGKSTITADFLRRLGEDGLLKLNADERTAALRAENPAASQNELNLRAAIETDAAVLACIRGGHSFLVETVLSSNKYRAAVLEAKERGYTVGLIYVSIYPPELSPQRIKVRVEQGGHDVESAKAVERYYRSHKQFRWFAKQADTFFVLDNSDPDGNPITVAFKTEGRITHRAKGINLEVDRAICAIKKKKFLGSILG